MRKLIGLLLVLALCGCGGGSAGSGRSNDSSGAGDLDESALPTFSNLIVAVDGATYGSFTDLGQLTEIQDERIDVAKTLLTFSLQLSEDVEEVECLLGEESMLKGIGPNYELTIQAAYLHEELTMQCSYYDRNLFAHSFMVFATDAQLSELLGQYIGEKLLVADSANSSDPYSGHRVSDYYVEIHRFISMAELYSNNEFYGLDARSEQYELMEQYLINTSEAFFEPCVDFDLLGDKADQCRSADRIGPYYRWRSVYDNEDGPRLDHAKVEWRAAGGIAQAVKAILLKHHDTAQSTETCKTSDEPSTIKSTSSLICRALNVRRLLYDEVWVKWNDKIWISSIGLSSNYVIAETLVPHYVAWTEFIVDLFEETSYINAADDCGGCTVARLVDSRRDFLFGFFYKLDKDGVYLNHSCEHPEFPRNCVWGGGKYSFNETGSTDISHSNLTMHLWTMYDEQEICNSEQTKCYDVKSLANTLNDFGWAEDIANDGYASFFPKFDVFINGYCIKAYSDASDSLHDFCTRYWATEEEGWLPHRRLIGFVTLGRFHRDLMIKLRQSADDYQLLKEYGEFDFHLATYIVFLYRAIALGSIAI
jgi:hypothetical protein